MSDSPYWLNVLVAAAAVLSAGVSVISAISAERSKQAADDAKSEALTAWKTGAEALEKANQLSREQHSERMEDVARSRRSPFGHALVLTFTEVLAKRATGATEAQIMSDIVSSTETLLPLQFAADEPSSKKFIRWLSTYSRQVPLPAGDVDAFINANSLLTGRIQEWIENPKDTLNSIRRDPGISTLPTLDPTDEGDFRNE